MTLKLTDASDTESEPLSEDELGPSPAKKPLLSKCKTLPKAAAPRLKPLPIQSKLFPQSPLIAQLIASPLHPPR